MSSSVFREAKVSANVAMLRSPDGVDVSVLGHFDHRHGIYLAFVISQCRPYSEPEVMNRASLFAHCMPWTPLRHAEFAHKEQCRIMVTRAQAAYTRLVAHADIA